MNISHENTQTLSIKRHFSYCTLTIISYTCVEIHQQRYTLIGYITRVHDNPRKITSSNNTSTYSHTLLVSVFIYSISDVITKLRERFRLVKAPMVLHVSEFNDLRMLPVQQYNQWLRVCQKHSVLYISITLQTLLPAGMWPVKFITVVVYNFSNIRKRTKKTYYSKPKYQ